MKKFLATVSAVALSLAMVALPSFAATADQPADLLCTDITDGSYSPKVDADANDPFFVNIPDGFTLVAYCVKAGTEPIIVTLGTPVVGPASVQIDHPNKDSVSHYQLKLIPTVVVIDVCDNIDGAQATVPEGMVLSENGTSCETPPPPTDVCDNIDGNQSEVPEGMVLAENGTSCETPEDPGCEIDCPDLPLEVSGTATDQVCVPSGDELPGDLVDGSIQLTVSDLAGVIKIEYSKDGGATTEVDLASDLLIEGLEPGTYDFVVTVVDGYELVDDFSVTVKADNDPECKKVTICHWNEGQGNQGSYLEIDVSVQSIVNPNGHATHENDIIPPFDYDGGSFPGLNQDLEVEGCGEQLPTEGPITPLPTFTPATCFADGSYTLTSPAAQEGLPTPSVFWYVNGVLTADGTYSVAAPASITVKAVANTGYTFDDFTTERTFPVYQFTAPTACDLTTLAFTGTDTQPALALTAFLGLLGLAMVRSGVRINRNNRQEA